MVEDQSWMTWLNGLLTLILSFIAFGEKTGIPERFRTLKDWVRSRAATPQLAGEAREGPHRLSRGYLVFAAATVIYSVASLIMGSFPLAMNRQPARAIDVYSAAEAVANILLVQFVLWTAGGGDVDERLDRMENDVEEALVRLESIAGSLKASGATAPGATTDNASGPDRGTTGDEAGA